MTDGTTEIETNDAEDGSHEAALLYAIVRACSHRYNVGGIFTSLEKACYEAKFNIVNKGEDYYYDWIILEFKPDTAVDDGKLACTATWDDVYNIPALKFEDGYSI